MGLLAARICLTLPDVARLCPHFPALCPHFARTLAASELRELCVDHADFRDRFGYGCDGWTTVTTPAGCVVEGDYTEADVEAVRRWCPRACWGLRRRGKAFLLLYMVFSMLFWGVYLTLLSLTPPPPAHSGVYVLLLSPFPQLRPCTLYMPPLCPLLSLCIRCDRRPL